MGYFKNFHFRCLLLIQCFVYSQRVSDDPMAEHVHAKNISTADDKVRPNNAPKLTQSTSPKDVKFFAFSKQTNAARGLEIKLGNVKSLQRAGFGKSNTLVLFAEGFLRSYNDTTSLQVTDAYNDIRNDVNVVVINYDKLSNTNLPFPIEYATYFEVLKNIPTVGKVVARFIQFVMKAGYLDDLEKVHFVGHSIGAHVGGSTGYQTQKLLGKKLGRISGLDPAGPFMNLLRDKNRLTADKANFVDVVHTDIELLGTPATLGSIDFYVNGGTEGAQQQCFNIAELAQNPFCPHAIAMIYFAESIRGVKFTGCPCATNSTTPRKSPCPRPSSRCSSPALFGEFADAKHKGKYYVAIK